MYNLFVQEYKKMLSFVRIAGIWKYNGLALLSEVPNLIKNTSASVIRDVLGRYMI